MVINGQLWTGASGYCSEVGFLPVYERLNKGSLGLPLPSISELYARLIQIYAVTVNPFHMMVLYRHPLLEGRLDESAVSVLLICHPKQSRPLSCPMITSRIMKKACLPWQSPWGRL